MKLSVLLADDHQLLLDGIRLALEGDGGFDIVGEVTSGRQVLPLVSRVRPDLVLLDLHIPPPDGLSCLAMIRERFLKVKVVVLSAETEPRVIETALRCGASAYIAKSVNPFDLPAVLREVCEGNVYTTVDAGDSRGHIVQAVDLTERETDVMRKLARGLTNEEIANELWVVEQTVKYHLTNIYRKLGVSNRTQAMRYAIREGFGFIEGESETGEHHERMILSVG